MEHLAYPVTFLITDLANRAYGKVVARKVVYIGFVNWNIINLICLYKFFRYNFNKNCNWFRVAFFIAQNLDIQVFDKLRKKVGLLLL